MAGAAKRAGARCALHATVSARSWTSDQSGTWWMPAVCSALPARQRV